MLAQRILFLIGIFSAATVGIADTSTPTTLRKSPALSIVEPSGAETQLSHFKGKVIVLEFLFVRSPHCLQLADMLNRLNRELGPRGFQPVAIAFGPYAEPAVLINMVNHFKLTYPVGFTTSEKVDTYLGRQGKERLKIPQMVVIDRRGIIRATSGAKGDPKLENEASLGAFIENLLKENASAPERVPQKSEP